MIKYTKITYIDCRFELEKRLKRTSYVYNCTTEKNLTEAH